MTSWGRTVPAFVVIIGLFFAVAALLMALAKPALARRYITVSGAMPSAKGVSH